jgi:hypothetical protein
VIGAIRPAHENVRLMTFNEQVCLTIVDKLLVAAGIVIGAFYVAKRIEAFKREQDVLAEVRKRQYDATLNVFEALGKFEYAVWIVFDTSGRDKTLFDAAAREYTAALATINQNAYLVGRDTTRTAIDVIQHLMRYCQEYAAAVLAGASPGGSKPNEAQQDQFLKKLNELRDPLLRLLPPLQRVPRGEAN